MKLLILGKDGQVGRALQKTLPQLGEVTALGRAEAPFDQPRSLAPLIERHRPDVIVNAAAYTAVDKAEAESSLAHAVNAEAVAVLGAAARAAGAWLVHYSTDFVFDGAKPEPYVETDPPQPLGVYGRTKLEGERAILTSGCRHLVFRVSWVYAAGHANFPQAILRLARERTRLQVVADQVGSPTGAGLIARVTCAAIAKAVNADDPAGMAGIYHLAAAGEVSRLDLARFIVENAGAHGARLALEPQAILPVATADYPAPAARPLNSRLDTGKLRSTFGVDLPAWQEEISEWLTAVLSSEKT
jgi:dTDP-4-dehydrorhamnose reductase